VLEEQENNNNRQIEETKRRARHPNPTEQQTAGPPSNNEGDVSKKKPNDNEDDADVKKKPPNGNEPSSHQTRPKRIYSTSAVDVLPDDTDINSKPSSSNVLSHLVRRTTHGGRNFRRFTPPPMKWKSPSWVTLEYNATTTTVKHICFCWDAMGVLVAIASSDNFIRIFDWDMIRAADRLGRSDRARLLSKSEYKMTPILQFQVPHPVTSLLWNPYHLDQLAMGFRYVCRYWNAIHPSTHPFLTHYYYYYYYLPQSFGSGTYLQRGSRLDVVVEKQQ
jgi:hypothetical protein